MPIRDLTRSRKVYSFYRQQPVLAPTPVVQKSGDDLLYFDTTHDLGNLDDTNPQLPDGKIAYVKSVRDYYVYHFGVPEGRYVDGIENVPVNGGTIGSYTTGPTWIRTGWGAEAWRSQKVWYIDPVNGEDNNNGGSAGVGWALRTFDELSRRLLVLPLRDLYQVNVVVPYATASVECRYGLDINCESGGGIEFNANLVTTAQQGTAPRDPSNASQSFVPGTLNIPYLGWNAANGSLPDEVLLSQNTTFGVGPGFEGVMWTYLWDSNNNRWYTPGMPDFYYQATDDLVWTQGVLVKSYDGQRTVAGNGPTPAIRVRGAGIGTYCYFDGFNWGSTFDTYVDSMMIETSGVDVTFYNCRMKVATELDMKVSQTTFVGCLISTPILRIMEGSDALFNMSAFSYRHVNTDSGIHNNSMYMRAWGSSLIFQNSVFVNATLQTQGCRVVMGSSDNPDVTSGETIYSSKPCGLVNSQLVVGNDSTIDLRSLYFVDYGSLIYNSGQAIAVTGSNFPLVVMGPNATVLYNPTIAPQLNPTLVNVPGTRVGGQVLEWSQMPFSDASHKILIAPASMIGDTYYGLDLFFNNQVGG